MTDADSKRDPTAFARKLIEPYSREIDRLKVENEKMRLLLAEQKTDPDAFDFDYFMWRLRDLEIDEVTL